MRTALFSFLLATSFGGDATLGEAIGDKDDAVTVPSTVPVITRDALPFTRTVTCTGSITITGTATNTPSSVTWSASPDGASGACTGTSSWSCAVAVSPNAAGEGVETITITATNGSGSDTDTVDVGFYVAGAHSCFLAQSIDGSYNSTLANNDPIATWENLGSSALDVTQGVAGSRPTYKTSIVGGQPIASFDGGDDMIAATASDWRFLHEDTQNHVYVVGRLVSGTTNIAIYATSQITITNEGVAFYQTISNDRVSALVRNNTPANVILNTPTAAAWVEVLQYYSADVMHDGTLGTLESKIYVNNSLIQESTSLAAYSSTGPTCALTLSSGCSTNRRGAADYFVFLIYNGSVLSATQRTLNDDVTEWALGGALPLTP